MIKFVEDDHVNNIIIKKEDSAIVINKINGFSDAVSKKYPVFRTCMGLYLMLLGSDRITKSNKFDSPIFDSIQNSCKNLELNFVKKITNEKAFYTIKGNNDNYIIALVDVDYYNSFIPIEALQIRNIKGYIILAVPYCAK